MKETLREYIDCLEAGETLEEKQWELLIDGMDEDLRSYAANQARRITDEVYGKEIFLRGLIEYTNYCRNDCYYCGIRRSNDCVRRYRLTKEDILLCCDAGWQAGFYTFVLQGGEDLSFPDTWYEEVISAIKEKYPKCAVTLSLGERTRESYQRLFDAGADRYLLRHETADEAHYAMLHPPEMSYAHRMQCLHDLKEIGYQVGCGFMVGSPGQTARQLARDMMFIQEFHPHMAGIGPFIPAQGTPFASERGGGGEQTLYLLSLIRIMEKEILLPATTALGTIHPMGREQGILAGANVVMPNISPQEARDHYVLYDNKLGVGQKTGYGADVRKRIENLGYVVSDSCGHCLFHKKGMSEHQKGS